MLTIKKILSVKLWVSASISILLVCILIPISLLFFDKPEVFPSGVNLKNGDRIFYNFLGKVKKDKSVIILGTSETGASFKGNNYWGLLDRDKDLNRDFYSFAGAGRCSYVYFPLILDNPKAFENLEIIYYINPTYWRKGLNLFHRAYYERYVNEGLANSVKKEALQLNIFDQFIKPGSSGISSFPFYFDRSVENYKSIFYSDINLILSNNAELIRSDKKINISTINSDSILNIMDSKINFDYNATDDFLTHNHPFPSINESSNFQYDMLKAFISLTKINKINCTFYLGPLNEIYGLKMNPEEIEPHYEVVKNIKTILTNQKVKFIDGSYQSKLPGTFNDIQHISEYGAYLTALDIKKYYEKN